MGALLLALSSGIVPTGGDGVPTPVDANRERASNWRPPAFPGIPVIWRWRHFTVGEPENRRKARHEGDFSVEQITVTMAANGESLAGGSGCAVAKSQQLTPSTYVKLN